MTKDRHIGAVRNIGTAQALDWNRLGPQEQQLVMIGTLCGGLARMSDLDVQGASRSAEDELEFARLKLWWNGLGLDHRMKIVKWAQKLAQDVEIMTSIMIQGEMRSTS